MSATRSYLKLSGAGRVGEDRLRLLEAIERHGSITKAGDAVGLGYRAMWEAVRNLNNAFAAPLVKTKVGGRSGGAANLTPEGEAALEALRHIGAELALAMERLSRRLDGDPLAKTHLESWSHLMRTSARNALRGVVKEITPGAVNSEVILEISPGVDIAAIVPRSAVESLALELGSLAVALIQESDVILATGEAPPRISARNALAGIVTLVEEGSVNSEVIVEIAEAKTLVATITRQSALDLNLKAGVRVTALINAPHVILAVE